MIAFEEGFAMTPLRQQMIDQMTVRGMAEKTKRAYLQAVAGIAKYYRRSPDQLNEQQCSSTCCI